MSVKTITVTEDAYNTIKNLKRPDESFSDLFLRIGHKQLTLKDIRGALKTTLADADELMERVQHVRKGLRAGFERRIADVRTRLERAD
jgi:predicted CopG family antitoxin